MSFKSPVVNSSLAMGAHKVLITSSGTGSAVNAIRALRHMDPAIEILASDTDPSAPGLFLADKTFLVPRFDSPLFAKKLFEIADREGEVLCLPTFSGEIKWFAKHAALLKENGIHTFLPSHEAVNVCDNKWEFWNFAKKLEIMVPEVLFCSGLLEFTPDPLNFPLFAKKIEGSGSRFAMPLHSMEEFNFYTASHSDLLIQKLIKGYEVTVDVFCDHSGRVRAASARKRMAVKSGQSVKGVTIAVEPFMAIIEHICGRLQLRGASNFQFIVNEKPYLIEVNPRFAAGGLMLSVHAGVNIPALCVEAMLDSAPAAFPMRRGQEGLCMTKYWNEFVYQS